MSKEYTSFDVIHIPAPIEQSATEWAQSDWIVCACGITKTAYRLNRKTGEKEPYSYREAMRALMG